MGLSGDKAAKATETDLRNQSVAAADKAATVDPMLQKMRDYWGGVMDWSTGKAGPVDVRNMPGGDVDLGLYNEARKAHDAGRLGTGIGSATDGANPNFSAAMDKENQLTRDINASGMLEDAVQGKVNQARVNLTGIGENQQQQNLGVGQLREGISRDYLNRPERPSFLQQLALGGLAGASGIASAYVGKK